MKLKTKATKDIFLRNCKEDDFKLLEKIADENNCSIARAFDLVMEAIRQAKIVITKEVRVTKR